MLEVVDAIGPEVHVTAIDRLGLKAVRAQAADLNVVAPAAIEPVVAPAAVEQVVAFAAVASAGGRNSARFGCGNGLGAAQTIEVLHRDGCPSTPDGPVRQSAPPASELGKVGNVHHCKRVGPVQSDGLVQGSVAARIPECPAPS